MEEMRSTITTLRASVEAMQLKLGEMEEERQSMLKTIGTFQAELTAKHNKFKVTNSKSFTILPKNRGEPSEFDNWKYKFRRFLECEKNDLEKYVG